MAAVVFLGLWVGLWEGLWVSCRLAGAPCACGTAAGKLLLQGVFTAQEGASSSAPTAPSPDIKESCFCQAFWTSRRSHPSAYPFPFPLLAAAMKGMKLPKNLKGDINPRNMQARAAEEDAWKLFRADSRCAGGPGVLRPAPGSPTPAPSTSPSYLYCPD